MDVKTMQRTNQRLQCCPNCGSNNAAIIDSRYVEITGWKRRRRECHACRYRWTTVELPLELVGGLKTVFIHLKTIERIAAESRLSMLDGRLTLAWEDEITEPARDRSAP